MSNVTKREAAAVRRARAAVRQGLDPAAVPAGVPLVERDAQNNVTGVTADGVALVERLARGGSPLGRIAAKLGIVQAKLKNLLAASKGDNALKLAFERGSSEFEYDILKRLLKHGESAFVPLLFIAKSRLGWREDDKATAAALTSNVTLVLPKPRTRSEFYAMMGVVDPLAITGGPAPMKAVDEVKPLGLPAPESEQPETEPTEPAQE